MTLRTTGLSDYWPFGPMHDFRNNDPSDQRPFGISSRPHLDSPMSLNSLWWCLSHTTQIWHKGSVLLILHKLICLPNGFSTYNVSNTGNTSHGMLSSCLGMKTPFRHPSRRGMDSGQFDRVVPRVMNQWWPFGSLAPGHRGHRTDHSGVIGLTTPVCV